MASAGLINPNPTVYQVSEIIRRDLLDLNEEGWDGFDSLEIFGTIFWFGWRLTLPFTQCEQ